MSTAPDKPHSAEYFGEARDYFWNRDFLDLMARRWRLDEASSLADIGCGVGHWARLLYPYLHAPARLAGVDREPRWVARVQENFRRAFPEISPELMSFHQGDATNLQLPDESFDVVTCQTVLMHLAKPKVALREMLRILRPGGLLVCVEPNNLLNLMAPCSLTDDEPVEEIVRRFEFWLRQHRGRMAAGEGNHSVGELLPGYFAEHGLQEIAAYQTDRPAPLFPPYATPCQRALISQERQWHDAAAGPWERDALRRLTLLGGGTPELFETAFAELERKFRREEEALASGTLHGAGGVVGFLVSGRKPC